MKKTFSTITIASMFLVSALLIPSILLTKEIIKSGFFAGIFLLIQGYFLYLFYNEEQNFNSWYSFIASITGLFFLLTIMLSGKSQKMEFIGFVLFIGYCLGGLIFFLQKKTHEETKNSNKNKYETENIKKIRKEFYDINEEEITDFREKDELGKLVEEFHIKPAPKEKKEIHLRNDESFDNFNEEKKYDFDEIFKSKKETAITGDLAESSEEESWNKTEYKTEENEELFEKTSATHTTSYNEEYDDEENYKVNFFKEKQIENTIKKNEIINDNTLKFSDYFKTKHTYEEKNSQNNNYDDNYENRNKTYDNNEKEKNEKISLEKVKSDIEKIDFGVKKISQKIREIGEAAIKEGEEKKKTKEIKEKAFSEKKPVTEVFASNNGTKYHYDKQCVSLQRVNKKNIVLFKDANEARKRGLKACGLCKK